MTASVASTTSALKRNTWRTSKGGSGLSLSPSWLSRRNCTVVMGPGGKEITNVAMATSLKFACGQPFGTFEWLDGIPVVFNYPLVTAPDKTAIEVTTPWWLIMIRLSCYPWKTFHRCEASKTDFCPLISFPQVELSDGSVTSPVCVITGLYLFVSCHLGTLTDWSESVSLWHPEIFVCTCVMWFRLPDWFVYIMKCHKCVLTSLYLDHFKHGRTCLDGYLVKKLGIFSLLYVLSVDYSTTFEVV